MDAILGDDDLEEIFRHLPPPSSGAAALVCKRWLRLSRSSTTDLSLHSCTNDSTPPARLSTLLSHFPLLSSLSLGRASLCRNVLFTKLSDHLLLSVASSCPNLRHLEVFTGAVSVYPLLCLSTSCPNLTSLRIGLPNPWSFCWISRFRSLMDLSITFASVEEEFYADYFSSISQYSDKELQLESLSLVCIPQGDNSAFDWLWRSCKRLKKLKLQDCKGIGGDSYVSSFVKCLNCLQEVELKGCRNIADEVLLKLAENCRSLERLCVNSCSSKEGLLQFIRQSRCNLQTLDLLVHLNLDNNHLIALAEKYSALLSLRLQTCFLETGEGLKTLGAAMGNSLEELALRNVDVVYKETGLLATVGQNLRKLRKLDLSCNDMLIDIEFSSMIDWCSYLVELKLRGCRGLTNLSMVSVSKICRNLELVDIVRCYKIEAKAVEMLVMNLPRLRWLGVEECKLSDVARTWASNKFIELLDC